MSRPVVHITRPDSCLKDKVIDTYTYLKEWCWQKPKTTREIMIPLPKNTFSEGDVYTCTWSTKTTQTSGKPVVMKLGSVRYLEITTNHDVQSPFLHSWECELGMGAAAHCCSNLEIRAGEDWHFLLCYVSSHVFSSNQKQNRVISLIFAQIKPSLVSLTSSIAKL